MTPDISKPSLKAVTRKERRPVAISETDLCTIDLLVSGRSLPLVIRPAVPDLRLPLWLAANRERIEGYLREHGGVLFRDFSVGNPEEFENCIKALSGELLEYTYRSTPRKRVAGNIYTSTEYPASRRIPLHNEMSYGRTWPLKIWFFSVTPAERGGETPIADSRKVYSRISPAVRNEFANRQVMYVRNYGHGLDLPWQDVFQTDDRGEVERLCRAARIEFEWKPDDGLTTRQVCQAVATHPATGEQVWFNQAHLFHVSSLDARSRELLLQRFTEDTLPRHAFYGDGSAIPASALDEIRDAYQQETIAFSWQKGDLLLLDNMLTAHGREAFEGSRRVLAGMADRCGAVEAFVEL